jgi:hypothetical protein
MHDDRHVVVTLHGNPLSGPKHGKAAQTRQRPEASNHFVATALDKRMISLLSIEFLFALFPRIYSFHYTLTLSLLSFPQSVQNLLSLPVLCYGVLNSHLDLLLPPHRHYV